MDSVLARCGHSEISPFAVPCREKRNRKVRLANREGLGKFLYRPLPKRAGPDLWKLTGLSKSTEQLTRRVVTLCPTFIRVCPRPSKKDRGGRP
jgi:hypothetical protein